jgi:hypothetical protein
MPRLNIHIRINDQRDYSLHFVGLPAAFHPLPAGAAGDAGVIHDLHRKIVNKIDEDLKFFIHP